MKSDDECKNVYYSIYFVIFVTELFISKGGNLDPEEAIWNLRKEEAFWYLKKKEEAIWYLKKDAEFEKELHYYS